MRVAAPFDANIRPGLKALALPPLRCEKSSGSNALNQQRQGFSADDQKPASPIQVELVCQEETARFDPFWDGPRLLPTFATQLMGQVIVDRRASTVSVQTAYGSIHPRKALLLDRKS